MIFIYCINSCQRCIGRLYYICFTCERCDMSSIHERSTRLDVELKTETKKKEEKKNKEE